MSSRSLWGGGLDGAARECGRAVTGRWVLAVDAGPEGAAEVSGGCRCEDHNRATRGVRISRNWENEDSTNTAGSETRSRFVKPEGDPDFPFHQLLSRWTPEEAPGECVTHLPSLSAQRWTPLR